METEKKKGFPPPVGPESISAYETSRDDQLKDNFHKVIFCIDKMIVLGIFGVNHFKLSLFRGGGMEKGFTKCARCGGLMNYEKIYYKTEHCWVWRCISCGEYIDQVILENRHIQRLNREKNNIKFGGPIYRSYSDTPSV